MRAKPEKRSLAENLRKEQGLSYADISRLTGVSKSTLSAWLKHIALTDKQQAQLRDRMETNRATFAARAWAINRERYQKARQQAYQAGADVLTELPQHRSVDELSLAMLYLGEGSKCFGRVQIANTQAEILLYFLTMLRGLYQIDENRLCLRLNLIKAASPFENDFIAWWKVELRYPNARFLKTQYDSRSRKETITDGYHGVCTLTYYDTYLQQRLIGLGNEYISSRSGNED
jgi:transcriptional regulator with XRE-family HTH domain